MAHYHLLGICGTAMGSLAGMLIERGHRVTGSDANVYPPMSTQLEAMGIPINLGYKAENLTERPDIVVVGNTINRGNPEMEAVLDQRWRHESMTEVLRLEFLINRRVLVVSGTHGKTTTTALAAWILETAGLNPSFLVGGVAENFGQSFRVTDGDFFVIEGDEYETSFFDKGPKFMHYVPEITILNNVEFDHADMYPDVAAIKLAFQRLIHIIPRSGRLVAGYDSPIVRELSPRALCPIDSFGLDTSDTPLEWTAKNIQYTDAGMTFTILHRNEPFLECTTPLAGKFNIRNILAVVATATAWGADPEKIREGLATFKSVKRRMQVRGEINGVTVIDDFAHHPTAVRETLDAISQKYAGRRVIAIFEPRSWSSRKKVFQHEYEQAFDAAHRVVLTPIFESFKLQADDQFSPQQVISVLREKGIPADVIDGADAIIEQIVPELREGDVVAIMSNGGFGGIHEKLLTRLKAGLQ
ncbi:MAG TPA: UDP-N-acetylmuramate:L-alanyl-gamma-D-glutamyl-meso-diaminopimelate ligase [Acidobacteriota bacterium]|nr:UDP-N-acetylmuramate:L-alanyl-gamma-D-glutamyl-meso-diaminopimelate ligase [Acidobacteriota bacterium]HNC43039.1 UDP-N-acetylmuramate:L-alanyl-gamma-D-glutamyl-meso-diaminopimelate ligase [Acidobacteriota bacterium]HNH84596.1 UDP-N-acetylmuramate:L-alanyl-gamma-D-glutamyl-meso-diaminopimelate ligase [Acidobacteriota bacterium]